MSKKRVCLMLDGEVIEKGKRLAGLASFSAWVNDLIKNTPEKGK